MENSNSYPLTQIAFAFYSLNKPYDFLCIYDFSIIFVVKIQVFGILVWATRNSVSNNFPIKNLY